MELVSSYIADMHLRSPVIGAPEAAKTHGDDARLIALQGHDGGALIGARALWKRRTTRRSLRTSSRGRHPLGTPASRVGAGGGPR